MAVNIRKLLGMSALLALSSQAQAQTREANHTLGSALDVWRVELRNPGLLLAMSAGDSDGVSELHKVEVKLTGTDGQMHAITERNPYFRVNGGPRKVANWIGVRQGDRVKLDRVDERNPDTYNLWVHTKSTMSGAGRSQVLAFSIRTNARELDCSLDKICNRGDDGMLEFRFEVPIPSSRSLSCLPETTYRLSAVNGSVLTLNRLSGGRQEGAELVAFLETGSGPRLALQSGEICIAATRLPPSLPDVRPPPPRIPRNNKLPGQ